MNNVATYIMFVFLAIVGGCSTVYCIVALVVMILYKLYRKVRYGTSLRPAWKRLAKASHFPCP